MNLTSLFGSCRHLKGSWKLRLEGALRTGYSLEVFLMVILNLSCCIFSKLLLCLSGNSDSGASGAKSDSITGNALVSLGAALYIARTHAVGSVALLCLRKAKGIVKMYFKKVFPKLPNFQLFLQTLAMKGLREDSHSLKVKN